MALLFMDSFDHYATADLTKKWTSITSTPSINASGGRRNGGALVGGTARYVSKTFSAESSFIVGFAVNPSVLTAGAYVQLVDAGTVQCSLSLNADGTLAVVRGTSTALTSGTSTLALATGSWYYIEWKVTIADSIAANSCKVRVNGVDWITVATGQDTKQSANATANSINFGSVSGTQQSTAFDDFYLINQSGSAPLNDFLGDCRIDTIYPSSDGNYTDFTPSTGTSHFALVDETAPNTTDYNSSSTVNQRDSYGLQDLAALTSQTIYGVQVNAAILKDDAGSRSVAPFVRHGGANADGTGVALSTSQTYVSSAFVINPSTGSAWTEAQINAMEAGVLVTA